MQKSYLRPITFFIKGKKRVVLAKKVFNPYLSFGLMFRKNSHPLLFDLKKEKNFAISSLFCKPFIAIWLDEKMHAKRTVRVTNWKLSIPGRGKYLLEIPITPKK